MEIVTGAHVAVAITVAVPRERMWQLITDVARLGEWSPEAYGGVWSDGVTEPHAGARFTSKNRYVGGNSSTVTCVVTEADGSSKFAWDVLDDTGTVGAIWRYELRDGNEPGTTLVHQGFTHGPGFSGTRKGAETDPQALYDRLTALSRDMIITITAMAKTDSSVGASR